MLNISDAPEYTISSFSETVISGSSFEEDTSLDPPKPRVNFAHMPSYVPPAYEEEAALFESTAVPRIRVPAFTSVFNIAATAIEARRKKSISSQRDFLEDEARVEPEALFDAIIRIRLPPSQFIGVLPGGSKEQDLFDHSAAPIIRLPSIASGVQTKVTPPEACKTTSVSYHHSSPEAEARAKHENDLFDQIIRVHFPTPQYIDIAATVEDENEVFTHTSAPIIRLPSFTSGFHTEATASAARKAIAISSSRHFPEDMARQGPEDLFDGVIHICFPSTAAAPVEGKGCLRLMIIKTKRQILFPRPPLLRTHKLPHLRSSG